MPIREFWQTRWLRMSTLYPSPGPPIPTRKITRVSRLPDLCWGNGKLLQQIERPNNQTCWRPVTNVVALSTWNLTVLKMAKERSTTLLSSTSKVDRRTGKILEMRPFHWVVKRLNDELDF
ncbi:uncharacterized protein PV09_01912 [Verruconis gallopava]|uniref:Uncharacterized protein n=1 Tax=Verruconis gallopava TaxID=253628 RepID=A0A0D1Z289_9PEZI|nr:uncharacterized protein PV09_01912 [Verruconis gallopava]KIW07017.1 hypothetical protein PV09_01912 [Verruconis gallopava]